jgi:hypothetical protein
MIFMTCILILSGLPASTEMSLRGQLHIYSERCTFIYSRREDKNVQGPFDPLWLLW